MHARLSLILLAFTGFCSSAALAGQRISEQAAHQKVVTAARQRLIQSHHWPRSDANVLLDHADNDSFFFDANATNPCEPGQDVCSSLLGHFRVDRRSGALFDIDMEPEQEVLP